VAAEILAEEEREQAAQTKVRLAPPSPHIGLHGVCSWVVSDAAFLSRGRAPPRSLHDVLAAWGAPQRKGKGKGKAGSGGAGGGPSTKAAAAAAGSSGQGSSRHSAPPGRIIGLSTEEEAVQAAKAAQQTEPQPAGGGSTKKEKERLRKERQRQRKIEEASEALQVAKELMEAAAGGVKAVEEAMAEAEKHASRSEPLAALVAEAKGLIEKARAAEAERASLAAEEAAAAAAVNAAVEAEAAAERQQLEEEMAAATLRLQQMQTRLGVSPMAPAPHPEEVLCLDARMDHIIIPCGHQCVCKGCAEPAVHPCTGVPCHPPSVVLSHPRATTAAFAWTSSLSPGKHHQRSSRHAMVPLSDTSPHPEG
jgi:hypothetical protein